MTDKAIEAAAKTLLRDMGITRGDISRIARGGPR